MRLPLSERAAELTYAARRAAAAGMPEETIISLERAKLRARRRYETGARPWPRERLVAKYVFPYDDPIIVAWTRRGEPPLCPGHINKLYASRSDNR